MGDVILCLKYRILDLFNATVIKNLNVIISNETITIQTSKFYVTLYKMEKELYFSYRLPVRLKYNSIFGPNYSDSKL